MRCAKIEYKLNIEMTTDPEDCIDDGQDAYTNIKIDASTELVGEHGGDARDPHGGQVDKKLGRYK